MLYACVRTFDVTVTVENVLGTKQGLKSHGSKKIHLKIHHLSSDLLTHNLMNPQGSYCNITSPTEGRLVIYI